MELYDILIGGGRCIVRDERGYALVILERQRGKVKALKMPNCSLGDYFYVLSYVFDLGFEIV